MLLTIQHAHLLMHLNLQSLDRMTLTDHFDSTAIAERNMQEVLRATRAILAA